MQRVAVTLLLYILVLKLIRRYEDLDVFEGKAAITKVTRKCSLGSPTYFCLVPISLGSI